MKNWTIRELLEAYVQARSKEFRADYADNLQIAKREKNEATASIRTIEAELERRCGEQG